VWFNAAFSSTNNSCFLYYDRAANQLNLAPDTTGPYLMATPGTVGMLQNGQCAVNMAATSVVLNGNTLTLNLAMTFKPAFSGAKSIFMYGRDVSLTNSGWQTRGSWTVPAPAAVVTADSVTPGSGSGAIQTFALQYSDSNGAANFQTAWVWFNAAFSSTSNSCFLYYDRAANKLNLAPDTTGSYLVATPGTVGTLQNSQCAVNMAATSVVLNGNTLTLNLAMTFKPAFGGAKNIYMYGRDVSLTNSGWQTRGTWTVPAAAAVVTADSVTPGSGTGATQTFALQYSDSNGAASFQTAWVWFNAAFSSTANSCFLYYDRAANQLNLAPDTTGPYLVAMPGSAGTLQNSQCSVNMATTSVVLNGNTLTLNLAMTFKPAFSGAKSIFMYGRDVSLTNSGWQTRGTWTVP
jgi:archaellum component FlaF (FlaF/FlaG flagellin family)